MQNVHTQLKIQERYFIATIKRARAVLCSMSAFACTTHQNTLIDIAENVGTRIGTWKIFNIHRKNYYPILLNLKYRIIYLKKTKYQINSFQK